MTETSTYDSCRDNQLYLASEILQERIRNYDARSTLNKTLDAIGFGDTLRLIMVNAAEDILQERGDN